MWIFHDAPAPDSRFDKLKLGLRAYATAITIALLSYTMFPHMTDLLLTPGVDIQTHIDASLKRGSCQVLSELRVGWGEDPVTGLHSIVSIPGSNIKYQFLSIFWWSEHSVKVNPQVECVYAMRDLVRSRSSSDARTEAAVEALLDPRSLAVEGLSDLMESGDSSWVPGRVIWESMASHRGKAVSVALRRVLDSRPEFEEAWRSYVIELEGDPPNMASGLVLMSHPELFAANYDEWHRSE